MRFSALVAAALLPAVALASPILEKRYTVPSSVKCGSVTYTSTQINRAITNARNDAASSTTYPHQYNNYEGFSRLAACSSSLQEFPLVTYSSGYTGGSPGPDRVIYATGSYVYCGSITHTGASNNAFVGCSDTY